MILVGSWTAPQTAAVIVGVVAAVVALIGVWINGLRQERHRRREFYADALEATYAYREFAYVVRRRRTDVPGQERVRISESLREIQRDLAKHEALMKIERCTNVAVNYRYLVDKTREVAGAYMRASWNGDGAAEDKQMNVADIDFGPLEEYEDAYLAAAADDLPAWKFWR